MRCPDGLANRESGPEPDHRDFVTNDEYRAAWYHWRAVRRDARPTQAEQDATFAVLARTLGYEPEDFQ